MTRKKIISIAAAISVLAVLSLCIYSISAANKAKEKAEYESEKETPETSESESLTLKIEDLLQKEETTIIETTTEEITTKAEEIKSLSFESNGNGTCTLMGIGNISDTCIVIPEKDADGNVVTNIAENAFYGNTKINTVQIPSTVTYIGKCAFGGCTSLVYISVSEKNTSFKDIDGILYSKSGDTLIHYPSKKGNETLNIKNTVKNISDMAFYNTSSLKEITFEGSVSDWSKINIGDKNYGLYSASVICKKSGEN